MSNSIDYDGEFVDLFLEDGPGHNVSTLRKVTCDQGIMRDNIFTLLTYIHHIDERRRLLQTVSDSGGLAIMDLDERDCFTEDFCRVKCNNIPIWDQLTSQSGIGPRMIRRPRNLLLGLAQPFDVESVWRELCEDLKEPMENLARNVDMLGADQKKWVQSLLGTYTRLSEDKSYLSFAEINSLGDGIHRYVNLLEYFCSSHGAFTIMQTIVKMQNALSQRGYMWNPDNNQPAQLVIADDYKWCHWRHYGVEDVYDLDCGVKDYDIPHGDFGYSIFATPRELKGIARLRLRNDAMKEYVPFPAQGNPIRRCDFKGNTYTT